MFQYLLTSPLLQGPNLAAKAWPRLLASCVDAVSQHSKASSRRKKKKDVLTPAMRSFMAVVACSALLLNGRNVEMWHLRVCLVNVVRMGWT